MSQPNRARLFGTALGPLLAGFRLRPLVRADTQGVAVMDSAEGMFLTSLPLVTWLAWLLPARSVFGSDGNEIPARAAYT